MDRTLGSTPLRLGRLWLPAFGLLAGVLLAALVPASGGLVGPGALAVVFALAVFTGLAKSSSA
jgi:hypothetical protein